MRGVYEDNGALLDEAVYYNMWLFEDAVSVSRWPGHIDLQKGYTLIFQYRNNIITL